MTPRSDPLGRQALFSPPAPGMATNGDGKHSLYSRRATPQWRNPSFGAFVVDCSLCHARSRVTAFELAARHLPFWLWVPWQRYSNLMSCPACEERTWMGVTWST